MVPLFLLILVTTFIVVGKAVHPGCECLVFSALYGKEKGIFKSPDFPKPYSPNIDCLLYTFVGNSDEIIELTLTDFDVHKTKFGIPNKYERKTDRGTGSVEIHELAFEEVTLGETEQSSRVPKLTENPKERTLTPNPTIGIAENDDITVRECNVGEEILTPSMSTVQNMTSFRSLSILSNNAKEPVASTSAASSLATTSNVFSPELVEVKDMTSSRGPSILGNNAKEPVASTSTATCYNF
ncbi:Spermadhesin [Gonioctena quinquepunctata]|nr:Spermadhesin [Gonioctena quinquepunctata]